MPRIKGRVTIQTLRILFTLTLTFRQGLSDTFFNVKRLILALFSTLFVFLAAFAQKDMVILRDGTIIDNCKIIQLSDSKLIYSMKGGSNRNEKVIPVNNIYMIKFENSRNIYITPTGRKMSNESGVIPKGADAIYLREGRQLIGYDTRDTDGLISYIISKKQKSLPFANEVPKSDVFMIRKGNGNTEIITPF